MEFGLEFSHELFFGRSMNKSAINEIGQRERSGNCSNLIYFQQIGFFFRFVLFKEKEQYIEGKCEFFLDILAHRVDQFFTYTLVTFIQVLVDFDSINEIGLTFGVVNHIDHQLFLGIGHLHSILVIRVV